MNNMVAFDLFKCISEFAHDFSCPFLGQYSVIFFVNVIRKICKSAVLKDQIDIIFTLLEVNQLNNIGML